MLKIIFMSCSLPTCHFSKSLICRSSYSVLVSLYVCRSVMNQKHIILQDKFSIAIRIDSVLRNFRVLSCHFATFIIFMYSNTQFPDNFKQ